MNVVIVIWYKKKTDREIEIKTFLQNKKKLQNKSNP